MKFYLITVFICMVYSIIASFASDEAADKMTQSSIYMGAAMSLYADIGGFVTICILFRML